MLKINKVFICFVLLTPYVFAEPLKINDELYEDSFTYKVSDPHLNNIFFEIVGDNIRIGSIPEVLTTEPEVLLSKRVLDRYSHFAEKYPENNPSFIGGRFCEIGKDKIYTECRISANEFFLQCFDNIGMKNAFFESRSGSITLKTREFNASNIFMKTPEEVVLMTPIYTGYPLRGISWKCKNPSLYPFSCFVQGNLSFKDFSTNDSRFIIFGAEELVFNPFS